jgi:NitT/TauT family transport system substrate-binding protein
VAAIVAAAAAQPSFTLQQGAPARVRVRMLPYLSYGVLHLARDEGLFAAEGIDVEFIDMDSSAALVPALVRGDLDVLPAVMSPALLNAIARRARIRLVASQSELVRGGCTTTGLVTRRELMASGLLSTAEGLKGRRLSGARQPATDFLLDKFLKPYGLSSRALDHVDIPNAIEGEMIREGRVDLASLTEPWLTRAVTAGDAVLLKPLEDVAPGFQYSLILYGPSLLDRRDDVGHRFMRAYLEAVARFRQGKTPRNLQVLAAATGLDRDLLSRTCWPTLSQDAEVNTSSVLEFQAWALSKGLVDRAMGLSEFYEPRVRAEARASLSRGR